MKLSIFAISSPIPPVSGASIDIYRRLKALTQAGFRIQLFVWADSPVAECKREAFAGICEDLVFIPARQDISFTKSKSLLLKLRILVIKFFSISPASGKPFVLDDSEVQRVLENLNSFSPDYLMADGLQCSAVTLDLRKKYRPDIPFLYRSHNREFKYNYDVGKNLPLSMLKFQFFSDVLRLFFFEPYLFLQARATLQISYHDVLFWKKLGFRSQVWLPPIAQTALPVGTTKPVYDLVILSSWWASQKVAGLLWFLRSVKPLLPADLKIVVAGRLASPELQQTIRESGCLFLGDVSDAMMVLRQGAVLANPVFGGSGVYMKMLDMMAAARPIVSTEDGITGLDQAVRDLISVANTPESFAKAIMDALGTTVDLTAIASYLKKYSDEECGRVFKEIATQDRR